MKKLSRGLIISFGLGSALGILAYDYFVHDSLDFVRSILVGGFVIVSIIVFNRISISRNLN